MTRVVEVTVPYHAQYTDPLRVVRGEEVSVGREDADFPGWRWCRAADGREGWVPIELLSSQGPEATVSQDYTAQELSVSLGERLTVEEARREWLLVWNRFDERGWIPERNTAAVHD
jgi:SH3-like domain-containing protein